MKHLFFTLIAICACTMALGQTHLYENPDFDRITADHKLVAIVPFKATVTLRPKQMKDITTEQMRKMELAEGREYSTVCIPGF